MDVKKALARLTQQEQTAMVGLLKKMQGGQQLTSADFDAFGWDVHHANTRQLCMILDANERTPPRWVVKGCPRNNDGTWDLPAVVKWKLEAAQAAAEAAQPDDERERLEIEKLDRDVQLRDLMLDKKRGEVIPLEEHLTYVARRANSLRQFLTDTMQANRHNLAGKSADELGPLLFEMAKQGMDAYIGGSDAAATSDATTPPVEEKAAPARE